MRSGTTIQHYEVGELLGEGGMGQVYRAHDTRLDRPVALKFLARQYVSDPVSKERFIREARSASALNHPNICTIHDVGETDDGELFIVMALYDGATLQERLQSEEFSVDRAVRILGQLAAGLQKAHASGIVHRDLKPANVMVGDDDDVRLLDFGVAKLQSTEGLTETGVVVGTASFMAPEQSGGEEVTAASDVWALGVIGYRLLTGRLPFEGGSPLVVLQRILSSDPDAVLEVNPAVPAAVAQVIHQALHKDPAERFADAGAFLAALRTAQGHDRRSTTASGTGVSSSGRWRGTPTATGAEPKTLAGKAASRPVRIAAVAVLLMAAIPVWRLISGGAEQGGTADLDENALAVMPFTIQGSSDYDYLSQGLVNLVGGRLDGVGALRSVDPSAIIGQMNELDLAGLNAERAAEMASSLGAGRFVLGQLIALPGEVSLSARLYRTDAESDPGTLVTVEGHPDSLGTLVDQLATRLLEGTLEGASARIQRNAAMTSGDLRATREFFRGEQFHREGRFDSASLAYNRAIDFDSTFALAHLMKSMNNEYTYDTDDYVAALAAARFAEGLPDRDRSLITAFVDQMSGRLEEAEQGYLAHLKRWPDEIRALYHLSTLYYRWNPKRAEPIDQARPYLVQALELDPDYVPALHTLARVDVTYGRLESVRELASAIDRAAPDTEWAVDVGTMAAFAANDPARIEEFTSDFASRSLLYRLYSTYNALRFSPDVQAAERLFAAEDVGTVNDDTGLPESVVIDSDLSIWGRLLVDLVGGRHQKVRDFITTDAASRHQSWTVWEAELVAADVVNFDRETVEWMLARLQEVDPQERLRNPFEPIHEVFTPAVMTLERDVNLARLLAKLGRFDEAWEIQRSIETRPPYQAFESLREDASLGLAAEIHHRMGNDAQALELLRQQTFQLPNTATAISLTACSHWRFLRAGLELAAGEFQTAALLYEGLIGSFTPPDKIFLLPAYRGLGEAYAGLGRADDAVRVLTRYVNELVEADAELVPSREAVAQRLRALQATEE